VTAKLTVLKDLKNPDPKLFTVNEPTPPAQQIRTVVVPEIELRKHGLDMPAPHWPDMSGGAVVGAMVMRIIVDRAGNVQVVDEFVSDNQGLKETAQEQLTKWRFQPYLDHGVPVQVISTLTFPFSVGKLSPDGKVEHFDSARSYFDHARSKSDMRIEGSQPFHMVASVVSH
jgi:hypothetical protein